MFPLFYGDDCAFASAMLDVVGLSSSFMFQMASSVIFRSGHFACIDWKALQQLLSSSLRLAPVLFLHATVRISRWFVGTCADAADWSHGGKALLGKQTIGRQEDYLEFQKPKGGPKVSTGPCKRKTALNDGFLPLHGLAGVALPRGLATFQLLATSVLSLFPRLTPHLAFCEAAPWPWRFSNRGQFWI